VYFVSETAQVELKSGRVLAPAVEEATEEEATAAVGQAAAGSAAVDWGVADSVTVAAWA
jgi:hypothetical protein